VRLSHKFRKLFSRDAAESLWENVSRWIHPVNSRRILAGINRTDLENLRERYPYRPNARKINAYEDAAYWIGVNVKRAQDLWLDRSRPLDILDLGCGAGYFLYLCRLFGHNGLGFDTDEEPSCNRTYRTPNSVA
jgi:ribosomal protein L11 methylase PrmA